MMKKQKIKWLACMALATSTTVWAKESDQPSAKLGEWGVALENINHEIKPGDDFYRHVNGLWLDADPIPSDRVSFGSFVELAQLSEERVAAIMKDIRAGRIKNNPNAKKIANLYQSYTNTELLNRQGLQPIQADLRLFNGLKTHEDVARAMGGVDLFTYTPMGVYISIDDKDPNRYLAHVVQSGLGLPDRDYYLKDEPRLVEIRKAYLTFIADMLSRLGEKASKQQAAAVLALEQRLATAHWPADKTRDAELNYNLMSLNELQQAAPQFPWQVFFNALGLEAREFNVAQKSVIPKLAQIFAETPVATWRAYLKFHYLHSVAQYLTTELDEANFTFYGQVLHGQPQQLDRATRGGYVVSAQLGEAIGQIYVERHFPPEHKQMMVSLVENLRKAFAARLKKLPWMSDKTRQQALDKLAKINVKVGYPDQWTDYSGYQPKVDDLLGNIKKSSRFQWQRELDRMDGPVDRSEWGLTPQIVNAYYSPSFNEIVFPAAILQPPFFDPHADPAVNYGGIGAVIGHEIGHGFDDQGSKYNGDGILQNWWTASDRQQFDQKGQALVKQYNQYSPLEGLNVNGQLTLGENIGDLGGIQMAYDAYQLSLQGEAATTRDGYSGDQRFFLSFAQIWRYAMRDDFLRQIVLSDPHSPAEYRVNGVLTNFTPWYEAFGVKQRDKLFKPQQQRTEVW